METAKEGKIVERYGNRGTLVVENSKGEKEKHKGFFVKKQARDDIDVAEAERAEELFVRDMPGAPAKESGHYLLSKVSKEKHNRIMEMMLKERLEAQKYGRRCRSIQELMAANKRGVNQAVNLAAVLHPWQNAGVKVKRLHTPVARRVC